MHRGFFPARQSPYCPSNIIQVHMSGASTFNNLDINDFLFQRTGIKTHLGARRRGQRPAYLVGQYERV